MRRDVMSKIEKWAFDPQRKPLVLRGARQVGKTWLMQQAGQEFFESTVYINFEKNPAYGSVFEAGFDTDKMLIGLNAISGETIVPGKTLLLLDEIQEVPKAYTALKYFHEEKPDLAIMAAGSYLGVMLHQGVSAPVGKVELLDVYPLHFTEFLDASGKKNLIELMNEQDPSLITVAREELIYHLKLFYYIGGMPGVINDYLRLGDLQAVRQTQNQLLELYAQDFTKHIEPAEVVRLMQVWNSIPRQLSKESPKFVWKVIKPGARFATYESAIMWLEMSGLIQRISNVSKPGLPLRSYADPSFFKMYLHDIGLLGAMSNLDPATIIDGSRIFTEFRGALTEQFIVNELRYALSQLPFYYQKKQLEIDFMIESKGEIIPIEVKAGENLRSQSLKSFHSKFQPPTSIRTSLSNYRDEGWLVNIPLFAFSTLFKKSID